MKSLCVNKNIIGDIISGGNCTIIIDGSYSFDDEEILFIKEDFRIACIEEKEVDLRYRSDGAIRKICFKRRDEADILKGKLVSLIGKIGWLHGDSLPDEVSRCKVKVLKSYVKVFSDLTDNDLYATGIPKCRESLCVMKCKDCAHEDVNPYKVYMSKYNEGYSEGLIDFSSVVTVLRLEVLGRYF